jgi:glutaredoxin 3
MRAFASETAAVPWHARSRASLCRRRRCVALAQRPDSSSLEEATSSAIVKLLGNLTPLWLVNNPLKAWLARRAAGDYDRPAVKAELDALLANDVVLLSATYCPFSLRAKLALRDLGIPFTTVETNTHPLGAAFVAELGERTGRTSIPHVFIAGRSIGGCNDGSPGLLPLIASGGLPTALAQCSPAFRNALPLSLQTTQHI